MGARTLVAGTDERVSGPRVSGHRPSADRSADARTARHLDASGDLAHVVQNHYEYGDLKANPRDLLVNVLRRLAVLRQLVIPRRRVPVPKGRCGCESPPPLRGGPHARHSVEGIDTSSSRSRSRAMERASIPRTMAAVGCRRWPGFGLTLRPATNEPCIWHGCWMSSAARSLTASSSRRDRRDSGTFHQRSPASSTSSASIVISSLSRRQATRTRRPIRHPGTWRDGWPASGPTSTSHCSRAWLVATGAWEPRSCAGFDGMHRAVDPACRYVRSANCVPERRQPRRNGAKPLATARLANVNGASENSRQPGNDT